jgi:glycosyltransferase involved in cell wall biosynthesis
MRIESLTMIAWDLDPFRIGGGTAYAVRRLADQLNELGIRVAICLPNELNAPLSGLDPSLALVPLDLPADRRSASHWGRCAEFCEIALKADERNAFEGSDAIVAHNDEAALFAVLYAKRRSRKPLAFWLHSLYDPAVVEFPVECRREFTTGSVLGTAVAVADLAVTSSGILRDAREFEWPVRLRALQNALLRADDERRLLTVESMGCLPPAKEVSAVDAGRTSCVVAGTAIPTPYVFFPGRPMVDKGLPIFSAIAERLRDDKITCAAVKRPRGATNLDDVRAAPIVWLPWLSRDDLFAVMRGASCVVLPSITEGFGLAAAESIRLGVPTLFQDVGGHRGLRGFPSATPIPLSAAERALLYDLWADLLIDHPDSWPVWRRHESALGPLIDAWADAVKRTVRRSVVSNIVSEQGISARSSERWGNRLRDRIENGNGRDAIFSSHRSELAV